VKSTKSPVILSQVAEAYALAGRKDKARAMMGGIEDQARGRYVCGFNVACVYSVLEERDQAFAWLEKAHRDRLSPWTCYLHRTPRKPNQEATTTADK
jgi:hypothetical protein